jgi:hypothetical protein
LPFGAFLLARPAGGNDAAHIPAIGGDHGEDDSFGLAKGEHAQFAILLAVIPLFDDRAGEDEGGEIEAEPRSRKFR